MSSINPYRFLASLTLAVFGLCVSVLNTVHAQTATIDITSHVEGDEITWFTPGAIPPSSLPIPVFATTGGTSILHTIFGLDGTILGDDWTGGDDGQLGIQSAGDPNVYRANLDVAKTGLSGGGASNPVTLRAFAYAGEASGYGGSTPNPTEAIDFHASDSVNINVRILNLSAVDADDNGIPDADALTGLTPYSGFTAIFQLQPDPVNLPNYYVERQAQSINDLSGVQGYQFFGKQFVIDFQLYNIVINAPNMEWFKNNRHFEPLIADATNMVLLLRGEQNPDYIVDNNTRNTYTDPLFDDAAFGTSDPPGEFAAQFPGANTPTIYFSIVLAVERDPGDWVELHLSVPTPIQVTISSTGLVESSDLELYRYNTTVIQSTTNTKNIYMMGTREPWERVGEVSGLSSDGVVGSFSFAELTTGVLYAAAVRNPDPPKEGGGGGGGGGCFIATAVYGTPMAREVESLRVLRDSYLLKSAFGSVFVDEYYRVSPLLADSIAEHAVLRAAARAVLMPVVWMTDIFIAAPRAVVLLLFSMGLIAFVVRRGSRIRS